MAYWIARRHSHRYGGALEGATEDHEQILDVDTDAHRLARRINEHFALPSVIRFERGHQFVIPPFRLKSNEVRSGGGGCDYTAWIEIKEAPRVTTKPCPACNETGYTKPYGPKCPVCGGKGSV